MSLNIIAHESKDYGKIKASTRYDLKQAEYFYNLRKTTSLSYRQIALNKKLNPKGLSSQWIQMIVKDFGKRIGGVNK